MNFAHDESVSRVFGYDVYQVELEEFQPRSLLSACMEHRVDILRATVPARLTHTLSGLQRVGLPYIQGPLLTRWQFDLGQAASERKMQPAGEDHREELQAFCAEFARPPAEVAANAYLPPDAWINLLMARVGLGHAWLLREGTKIQAVAFGVAQENEMIVDQIVSLQSHGEVLQCLAASLRAAGYASLAVDAGDLELTQACAQVGGRPSDAFSICHINPFFSTSGPGSNEVVLELTGKDLDHAVTFSGDINKLHFDKEFALSHGLTDRAAHGLCANGFLSRYFGVEHPGHGTLILDYKFNFFQPLYLDQPYRSKITFPYHRQTSKGDVYLSVARIYDGHGSLCLLAYTSLMKPHMNT